MNTTLLSFARSGALLAINLLFVMAWGFAGLGKFWSGMPPWFGDKFGPTILGRFPGVAASFWLLAAAEVLGFLLAVAALLRVEFLGRRPPTMLTLMLVWSLFVFVQLGFGVWLIADYTGTFQMFAYFGVTLVALQFTLTQSPPPSFAKES